ncbi:hypothetical protein K1T71_006165 [Dendrolimus kikuchii]|uniref:Uncharacterized protein n=1 Tax=Dendrolimus kikuchii TaxID=765133 RepID=A0ACC1D4M0_9NEOP|nr:hypothetical protein K1T71_006165 [Dendrolimus kikuchii]
MYKLVVLFALVAAGAAKPGAIIELATTNLTPVTTVYTNQASSVFHPAPIVYLSPSSPHYIKKRSAPKFIVPTTYVATSPAIATTYTAPLVHSAPLVSSTSYLSVAPVAYTSTHIIKKRGAILPTTYIAPTTYTSAPIVTSTYTAATPLFSSSPLISHPLTYSHHFIKKRSAPLLSTYIAPATFSHQSRIDVQGAAPLVTSYPSPLAYTSPVFIPHAN